MTKDERNDSYGSLLQAAGAARQYGTQIVDLGGLMMGARFAYTQGGLMARIVDLPADLATARGVKVEGAGPDLYAEMDRLKLLPAASDALRWSLLDGGGAMVVLSEDAGTDGLAGALSPDNLQQITEFRVVSLVFIRAGRDKYEDPSKPNYGMPIWYDVTLVNGGQPVRVHESRLIEVPGAPMATTAGVDLRDVPWAGRGLSPKTIHAVQRYERGVKWSEKLLERVQQATHKMKGLAQMLQAKQEEVVRARIDLVDGNRSNINGVAIDSEDEYTVITASMTGVKDIIGELKDDVAAQTGMPVSILFGRAPAGLNSTGDSEWDMVFDQVSQLQNRRLTPAMERAISLIYAQKSVELDRVEEWKLCWNPLKQQSAQQMADVENKKADTTKKVSEALVMLQGTLAVSQDEAHDYLKSARMFGLEPDEEAGSGAAASQYAGQT